MSVQASVPSARIDQRTRTVPSLERAIVEAVAYADVFDYPLTADEVHRYLDGVSATRAGVSTALSSGRLVPGHPCLLSRSVVEKAAQEAQGHERAVFAGY